MAKHVYRFHIHHPHPNTWHGQEPTLGWQPHVDVYRNENGLLIQLEAPGVDEASLRLHFEAGALTIEGRRDRPALPPTTRCLCMEIEHGAFRRTVALPPDADSDAIEARYEAGLLTISVPLRQPKPASRRVNID